MEESNGEDLEKTFFHRSTPGETYSLDIVGGLLPGSRARIALVVVPQLRRGSAGHPFSSGELRGILHVEA